MTFVSTIGQSLDQIERIKVTQLQLADLQTQLATGKKTQVFKGLGTDVVASERARDGITRITNYVNNIDIADRRLKLMYNSLTEIKSQAESVLNAIEIQTMEGEYEIEAVSDLARNTAAFLRDLVNERDGDRFLFGGAETLNAPLSDNGSIETYMRGQLTDWINANIDTDQLIDSYQNSTSLTDTIIGYSATLSSGNAKDVYVRVDNNSEINYTILGNNDGIRDIIAGVNMVAQLDQVLDEITLDADDPTGTAVPPGADNEERNENFYQLFNNLGSMLNRALDQVDSELYKLSQNQAKLENIKQAHQIDQNTYQDIVSEIEDADINEVAVKLNSLQIQLEASFRVTASISSLSLVNFI